MEADHTAQDDPPEGSEEVEKEDPGNWRKRLRLKQVAVQLPVIQNIDEGYGAEESEEGLEKNKVQTARKSFKRPPLRGQDVAPGPGISGKILRFSCSECTGQATFSPNDLLKHFQGVHQGSLPTFPCDMCSFVTHDFSSLQRHRIGHRDTFVRCDICNDGIQYTLLQLTRHFNMFHSLNGFYCCEKCKFSTKDVGTFVQHTHRHNDALYKCSKCQHISHGSGEHQKHILTHSGPYPFSCQFCDYGAPRKDYVAKHMAAVHREEMERLNKRRASEDGQKTLVNSTPGLKLLLTKNPARQTHWMSKGLHALSGGGLLDEYGRLANPEKTLEETQQFLERTVAAQRDCKKWAKGLKSEQQYTSQTVPATAQPKQEPAVSPNAGFLNPNSNGLTVLMVKNKITIPPNCTTKVMGFKMVDGKKHLVLKVIPSAKQEPCAKTEDSLVATSVASASSVAEKEADDNALEPCKGEANTLASSEEGTGPPSGHLDSSNSEVPPNPKVSPNGVAPPGSPCSLPSRMENIDIASALVQVQAQENGEQEQELVSTTAREVEEEQPPGATENDDDAAPSPPSSPAANAVSLVSKEQCSEPPSIDGGAKVGKGEEHLDSPSESQEHSAKNVEGPNVADGEKASGSSNNAAILGKILEEHSDAIISQQLEKERIGTAVPHEAIRTPTTTLRILQPLNLSDGTKTSESQDFVQTLATASPLLSFSSIAPTQGKASEKHGGEGLACKLKKARLPSPRRSHQGAKRKRSKKPSMEDSLESPAKARRLSSKKSKEKEAPAVMYWEPAPREEERTLRLLPLSTVQPVKCPRRNQPVVVLNHPDADIPEVASLMRTVNKFRGEVTKVALSQRTVAALSELDCSTFRQDRSANCHPTHGRRVRPEGTVRERFILKLRLKKTSRNKYKVVNTSSDSTEWSSTFSCWFCGRIFDNQEEWIGHGQRHLMEATRDWNKLFS
ncbi:hypothetical protein COCON_G00223300 [Conger conger]|uniref:C2H2-type domain-containing protein n=1 Tax=Conger conger TaxID=82655 RepID=A0A9Q1CWR3_CONCO|nr:hypothetical protein COCON_G00223300 [Conger conger]